MSVPTLSGVLLIERCPHCNVDRPNMTAKSSCNTQGEASSRERLWVFYGCNRCGGIVAAWAYREKEPVQAMYPQPMTVDSVIPDKARAYLLQAIQTLHAPAGAVMLAASAVDAMLKAKNYTTGSLYERIEKAAVEHLITEDMAHWAHDVRLDANDQRHADPNAPLPSPNDAQRCVEFAEALGQFLFVLPARVQRGRAAAAPKAGGKP